MIYTMDLIYEPPMLPVYKLVSGPWASDDLHPWSWARIQQMTGFTPRGQERGLELDVAVRSIELWKTREEVVAEKLL